MSPGRVAGSGAWADAGGESRIGLGNATREGNVLTNTIKAKRKKGAHFKVKGKRTRGTEDKSKEKIKRFHF